MLLSRIKVIGRSMEPAFKHNQIVITSSIPFFFRKPRIGDVVVLLHKRYIIKRIAKVEENRIFVTGDNRKESTDSRDFGWITKEEVVGKVIFKF